MRIVFAGTPAFSVPCLQALLEAADMDVVGVVSQPDRKSGRGMKLRPSAVKQAAMDAGIDLITPERLRDNPEALAWLRQKRADILVVVAFGMILPPAWLEAVAIAPLNVHASLLPRWRGAAPVERALLAGDRETGVCIMRMEEGLDTGPLYACRRLPIGAGTTVVELRLSLAEAGARLLLDTLPAVVSGLKPAAQAEQGIIYAKKITTDERIVDWRQSATSIDRLVRCFSPQPGARASVAGRWLKLIEGHVTGVSSSAAVGTVAATEEGLDVVCGEGSVYRVTLLQPEGKRAMTAVDFLRGARLARGDLLL